jgi:hypothetical protein
VSHITTTSDRYATGKGRARPCSTRGWQRHVEWTSVRRWYSRGGIYRRAIDRLIRVHDERLPDVLYPGRDVTSRLDDPLFPDAIVLMTGCGSNGPWDPVRSGPVRLHSLIGFPSSF